MVVSRHLESVFDMFKVLRAAVDRVYQHDIEPAKAIGQMISGQVLRRQLNQFFPFLFMHRFDRSAEFIGAPGFDFDEDQYRAVLRYKIQFTEPGTEIAAHDAIAFFSEVPLGRRLSFLPNASSGVKCAH